MNQRAREQPRRSGDGAPVGDIHLAAPPGPPAHGNLQQHQHEPADARSDGQRQQQGQPLPQRHACDLMFYQHARKFALHLPRFDLIVEFRNLGQRVGRDEPDLAGARIGDAHQIEVGFDIAGRHGAQFLPAERNAFLRSSFRLGKGSNSSGECRAVQHGIELAGDLLAFGLPARRTHLQILRRDVVVAGLRGLQESEDGARRRGATQWIVGRVRRAGGCGWRRWQHTAERQLRGDGEDRHKTKKQKQ